MSELKNIHRKAIELAKEANILLENGDKEGYVKLTEEAFGYEKQAAEMLFDSRSAEPTRSVLYRSAATLAYNCGKFSEAETLIYAALSGSPYSEIKSELEQLLKSIKSPIDVKPVLEEVVEYNYMSILRDNAINIKIESKTNKHSKAIYSEHVVDFLKTINSSYINYSKVNFRKVFSELDEITEKMLDSFLKQSKPLCVNFGFGSFGVSIVADNKTMFNSDMYSEKFNEWKENLFNDYKEDVLLPDYNSDEFLNAIKQKYTDEERLFIYSPIIDKIKETTPYKMSLTEDNFVKIIKTYQPPQKNSKDILIPISKKQTPKDDTKVLARSLDLIPASGKGRKKNLDFETLENAEWKTRFKDIEVKTKTINLNEEYLVKILYNSGSFTIEDSYLDIFTTSPDYDAVIYQYKEMMIDLYSVLLERQDLSQSEKDLLSKLNQMTFSRNW